MPPASTRTYATGAVSSARPYDGSSRALTATTPKPVPASSPSSTVPVRPAPAGPPPRGADRRRPRPAAERLTGAGRGGVALGGRRREQDEPEHDEADRGPLAGPEAHAEHAHRQHGRHRDRAGDHRLDEEQRQALQRGDVEQEAQAVERERGEEDRLVREAQEQPGVEHLDVDGRARWRAPAGPPRRRTAPSRRRRTGRRGSPSARPVRVTRPRAPGPAPSPRGGRCAACARGTGSGRSSRRCRRATPRAAAGRARAAARRRAVEHQPDGREDERRRPQHSHARRVDVADRHEHEGRADDR